VLKIFSRFLNFNQLNTFAACAEYPCRKLENITARKPMDTETIIKVVGGLITAAGVIAGIAKYFFDHLTSSPTRLRESYKFAREFFSDLRDGRAKDTLVRQRGFHALTLSREIAAQPDACEYISSLDRDPESALRDFAYSYWCLNFNANDQNTSPFKFKKWYQSRLVRNTLTIGGLIPYFLFAFAPIIFFALTIKSNNIFGTLIGTVFLSLVCGPLAYFFLRFASGLVRAGQLIDKSARSTEKTLTQLSFLNGDEVDRD
jgi:hypothetical protein